MSKKGLRLGAMAATSAIVLGAGATAAGAASSTPPTLASVQANAAAAITLRVNDLNSAVMKVQGAKYLGSEAATLTSFLQQDIAPLQTLGQQIAADTTVQTAQAAAQTIYTDFRVLALVLPAARSASTAITVDNGNVPNLTADSAKAAAKVTSANSAELTPLIDNLNAEISAAQSATSAVAGSVLGYTPSEWNANQAILNGARGQISSATNDIKLARQDLVQIRADLKHAGTAASPAATPTTAS
jgi:hypothetical protein